MPACAVAVCRNYTKTTKGTDVKYFSFPRDPCVQEEWVFRCGRDTQFNVANSRICSEHFSKEQFERDLMNELLGLPTKRTLKPSALPTINIGYTPASTSSRPLSTTHLLLPTTQPATSQSQSQAVEGEEDTGYYDDDDDEEELDEDKQVECGINEDEENKKKLVGYHCNECAAAGAEYSLTKTGRLRRVVNVMKQRKRTGKDVQQQQQQANVGAVTCGMRRGGRKRSKSWSRAAAFSNSQTLSERLRTENLKLKKQVKELQSRLQRDDEDEEKEKCRESDWEASYKALQLKYEAVKVELDRYREAVGEEMVVRKTGDLHEYAMKPNSEPELRVLSALEAAVSVAVEHATSEEASGGAASAAAVTMLSDDELSFEQPIYVIELPPSSNTDIDMETAVLLQQVA